MTENHRMAAWHRLHQRLQQHLPGSPGYTDETFQAILQEEFSQAYDPERPHAAAAQKEIDRLMAATPPGTPAYGDPAHQERLKQLFSMVAGDDPVPGIIR
jgi:hypothetical protein